MGLANLNMCPLTWNRIGNKYHSTFIVAPKGRSEIGIATKCELKLFHIGRVKRISSDLFFWGDKILDESEELIELIESHLSHMCNPESLLFQFTVSIPDQHAMSTQKFIQFNDI
jgi:hypothetical protein